jgi:2-(1,2-epoxy-1,2-dihydrophenyl)acetyl-CoA isomerase
VEFERDSNSAIARITLNRPEKLNSFTRRMHEDLREALRVAQDDPGVRVIVLAGRGSGLCAGQDLSDLSFEPGRVSDLGELVESCFNPLIRQIKACPKPILGKVHGIAAGAGASLAMACDLTVAARSASFLRAFANIGLLPDSGRTWFLHASRDRNAHWRLRCSARSCRRRWRPSGV